MAAPEANLLDDYERASLGANYTQFDGTSSQLGVAGSSDLANGSSAYSGSYLNTVQLDRPCEAYILNLRGIVGTNRYFGIQLLTTPNNSTPDGYKIASDTGATPDNISLYRVDDGTDTSPLATYNTSIPDNIDIAIQLDATHLRLWTDEGAGWVERTQVADTNYSGPFFITIDAFSGAAGDILVEELHGREISAAGGPSQRFRWRD